jgi:hypothetical protein
MSIGAAKTRNPVVDANYAIMEKNVDVPKDPLQNSLRERWRIAFVHRSEGLARNCRRTGSEVGQRRPHSLSGSYGTKQGA